MEILYARGFLLTKEMPTAVPAHWDHVGIGNYNFYYDPISPIARREGIIFFGHAVDLVDGNSDISSIAKNIKSASSEIRQDIFDRLAGRYVVVIQEGNHLTLQQDALALRGVYHTDTQYRFIAGSHLHLVAQQVGAPPNVFSGAYLKEQSSQAYPGRETQNLGIVRMLPNTEVDSISRRATRIFPRVPLVRTTADEAANFVIEAVDTQLSALPKEIPILASLSAGFDSRVSMALLKNVLDRVQFFTYELGYLPRNNGNRHDRSTALQLAEMFELNHTMLDISAPSEDAQFNSKMMRNTMFSHSRSVAKAYLDHLPHDGVHIRSNAFEIARCYYQQMGVELNNVPATTMRYLVTNGKSTDQATLDAFETYRTMTGFEQSLDLGYDGFDLFYWEHRMGSWMAPILHESDIAHETHILINSRNILAKLLGVPFEDRFTGKAFRKIISERWPQIGKVPINGEIMELN